MQRAALHAISFAAQTNKKWKKAEENGWTWTWQNKILHFSSLSIFSSFIFGFDWVDQTQTLKSIFVTCFNCIIINRGFNDPS